MEAAGHVGAYGVSVGEIALVYGEEAAVHRPELVYDALGAAAVVAQREAAIAEGTAGPAAGALALAPRDALADVAPTEHAEVEAPHLPPQQVEALRQATSRYPFMMDANFIALARQVIRQQLRPEYQAILERRLNWLEDLANQ